MGENISFDVSGADRKRLLTIAADCNTPAKVVWRAKIVLATPDGLGTMAIMRETGKSKPFVWTKTANAILKNDRRALLQLALHYDGNQASESEH